jgi:hypothetical protein
MSNTDSELVEGYADYWNAEKKFGFAYVGSYREKVFFHLSNQRVVDGTPEEPVITSRRPDVEFHWSRLNRGATMLVMRVARGPKGLRATVWGVKPKRTWLEELPFHQTAFARYEGGEINFSYSHNPHGRPHREVIGRLTTPVTVALKEPGVVRMAFSYEIRDGHYGGVKAHEERTFELTLGNTLRSKELPYGRYAMDIYLPLPHGEGEWLHLVFNPEWNWEEIN